MTKQHTLQKAITKAVRNGWNKNGMSDILVDDSGNLLFVHYTSGNALYQALSVYDVIYAHSFAQALWGEEPNWEIEQAGPPDIIKGWEHQLQEMVIAEDPIKYLEENLDD